MAQSTLTGTTVTPQELYANITKAGVSPAEAAIVVGNWIVVNAGGTPRVFSYRTAFPATDPGCAPQFARSFVHQDWVDGEDVVQAEQTTGEEGFNLRFHRIESDLDALGRDVAKLFLCMSEMRASLRLLLDELSAEINLINRTLAEHRGPKLVQAEGSLVKGAKYAGTTRYFNKNVNIFETEAGMLILPMPEEVEGGPLVNPRVQRTKAIGQFVATDEVVKYFESETKPVTRNEFLKRFGDRELEGGLTVAGVFEILPATTRFSNADEVAERVAEREGRALRSSGVEDEALAATFRLQPGQKLRDAPVDRFETVPSDARAVLTQAGVSTMGELAKADPQVLASRLRKQGVDVSAADVGGWVAVSKGLGQVM